ncbi:MAG: hypothetical protein RL272_978 [Candidatus Parcubacteria bacterium]|jgi:uncharacterized LabA/DUF88 family protein
MTFHPEADEGKPAGSESGRGPRDGTPDIAMLIDWDNFYSQCAERGVIIKAARLKEIGRAAGRIRWAAVFVDATKLTVLQRIELFTEGFDICDCPKLTTPHSACLKDTVDAAIVERMHALADFVEVDEVMLGSADRDYLRVVQHLRDAGKRVRILTPTTRDRPTLVQHSDGAVAYACVEDTAGLARDLGAVFSRGAFAVRDGRSAEVIRSLARLVVLLDGRLDVNARDFGFRRIMEELLRTDEVRADGLTPEALKERLEFLIDRDIVRREQDDRKYYRYRVSRAHPFVAFARKESGIALARPPSPPATAGRQSLAAS